MAVNITNISLLFSRHGKSLKLGNPKVILNSEGPILTVLTDIEGRHSDLYLYVALDSSPDYICIKVKQDFLLAYLREEIALQELLFSCPKSSFYYEWCKENKMITFELPIFMLSNYPIFQAALRISDLPYGIASQAIILETIESICHCIERDPYGEENLLDEVDEEDIKHIIADAGLFLRLGI